MAKLTQEDFIQRCREKHNSKYDYTKTIYTTTRHKVIVTCPMHGDFTVLADNHLRTSGCCKCGRLRGAVHTIKYQEFLNRVSDEFKSNLEFTESDYVNSREPIKVLCKKHNFEFKQRPYDIYNNRHRCKYCRSERSSKAIKSCTEDFISKCLSIYGDKFTYDKVQYNLNKETVVVTCKQHGDFCKTPKELIQGAHCKECMKLDVLSRSGEFFYEKFKLKWSNYTLKSVYAGSFKPVQVNCKLHGDFFVTPEQCRTLIDICDGCRVVRGSQQELKITELLDKHNITYVKHKKIKSGDRFFEIDIFIPSNNIAIEVNGLYWHRDRENGKYSKDYHLNKTRICKENGISLLHFFDTEIDTKFSIVSSIIENKLGLNKFKVHARKTSVRYIDSKCKKEFLNDYHIQGNDRSSVYIGLYSDNELLSVMTFGNRKITKMLDHELMRYCVKSGYNIVGGFSKMLKFYLRNNNNIKTIKTYADKRYSDGNVYTINGFKHIHDSSPSYWYFHGREYKLYHRYNFAKHLLHTKLEIFDKEKTEIENMRNNNYYRVWDCGHCVFKYTST